MTAQDCVDLIQSTYPVVGAVFTTSVVFKTLRRILFMM